jgi:hypothetical protein
MKDTAKKAKEANAVRKLGPRNAKQSSDLPLYLRKVLDSINAVPRAKEAFRRLVQGGCHPRSLLVNLYAYCGATNKEVQHEVKAARHFLNQFQPLADRLIEDADEVEMMMRNLESHGIKHYEVVDLPAALRSFADSMAAWGRAYKKGIGNLRPRRKGNVTTGRTPHLFYLVCFVEGATDQPCRELAKLVAAVRGDSEPNYVNGEASLHKAVARLKKKDAIHCMALCLSAQGEFAEAKTTHTATSAVEAKKT